MHANAARILLVLPVLMVALGAAAVAQDKHIDGTIDGKPALRSMVAPFDPDRADDTYKVYTHIYAPGDGALLTKGPGGLYPHHRGLFIGWNDTLVPNEKGRPTDYDTWHMSNCYQQLARHESTTAVQRMETSRSDGDGNAPIQEQRTVASTMQRLEIDWSDRDGEPFIKEDRTITAAIQDGMLVVDFTSAIASLRGAIELRGDLQHAGMQVRLANELSDRQEETAYILPESAETRPNDEVLGAWWACCSAEIEGARRWVLHMTAPDHPTGVPVYSIRAYGRFGAFSEHDLVEGEPLTLRYRVIASDAPLDRATCEALYAAYAAERTSAP